MLSSTLGQRGEVALPSEVRKILDLKMGDKLIFDIHDHQVTISKKNIQREDELYYSALSSTLNEWNSDDDEQAYSNL